jgi:hypothetical protein
MVLWILETQILFGVLDVENKKGDDLIRFCDASVGVKEDVPMCMLACKHIWWSNWI